MLEYSSPGAFLPTRLGRDTTSYLFALQDVVAALLDLAPDDAVVARARRAVVRIPRRAVLYMYVRTYRLPSHKLVIMYTDYTFTAVCECNMKCMFSYEYIDSYSALVPYRSRA